MTQDCYIDIDYYWLYGHLMEWDNDWFLYTGDYR